MTAPGHKDGHYGLPAVPARISVLPAGGLTGRHNCWTVGAHGVRLPLETHRRARVVLRGRRPSCPARSSFPATEVAGPVGPVKIVQPWGAPS
jgi:hypothetical protein